MGPVVLYVVLALNGAFLGSCLAAFLKKPRLWRVLSPIFALLSLAFFILGSGGPVTQSELDLYLFYGVELSGMQLLALYYLPVMVFGPLTYFLFRKVSRQAAAQEMQLE